MLSHLRFHRRAPSNPSSPTPDQVAPWDDTRPRSPSNLQPLARVSSADADLGRSPTDNSQSPPARSAFDGNSIGFMGGVTLHQYRRNMQDSTWSDSQSSMATSLPEKRFSRTKAPPPPINTGLAARPALTAVKPSKSSKSSSFFAPTDLQLGSGGSSARPSGARGSSDTTLTQPSGPPPEPAPKGRKSLPFLRNSMSSLLLRRKTGNHPPEPQPIAKPTPEVSIRGTRIHDFSAPRPKKIAPSTENASSSASQAETPAFVGTPGARTDPGSTSEETVPPVPPKDEPAMSVRTSSSATSAAATVGPGPQLDSKASVRTTASRSFSISKLSMKSSVRSAIPKHMKSTSSRFSFDMIGAAKQEKLLEERHRMREQEKKPADDTGLGHRDSRFDDFDEDFDYDAMMEDDGFGEEEIPYVDMDYDIEEEDPEAAADPDNDQENFAGFVFQRSNPASAVASPHSPGGMLLPTPRDASGTVIGYAMTKDTTPGLLTPAFPDPSALPKLEGAMDRLQVADEAGRVADQPVYRPTSLSAVESASVLEPAQEPEPKVASEAVPEAVPGTQAAPASQTPRPNKIVVHDDIYFDDGLADELDFSGDGFVLDESIFDNNDTDKYGRPIPGAFAQAQAAMRAAQLQASNRTSDMTSDLSGVSGAAASTAHTSVSAAIQQEVSRSDPISSFQLAPQPPDMLPFPGQDLAYQAALAEAAQQAAASGKFRRNSSPTPPAELTVTSPTDSSKSANNLDSALDDYEKEEVNFDDYEKDYDDYGGGYQDDYDFDDDAIIAEANAEALANDSDGWYGQEFGFYSAPIPQVGYGHHGNGGNGNNANGQSAALNAENLFSYANGGYFGPAGDLGRSKSGRIVCREPNLTPITERSEYSNRNSIMSLTLPPAIGSDTGRNSLTMNSPGLAQLALLGDDENSLSVAAYMKARNRAFGAGGGGSQVSSREGSPKSERGPSESPFGGHLHAGSIGGHVRKGSAFSLWSNSDAGAGEGSGAASPVPQIAAAFPAGGFNGNQGANGVNGVVVSPLPQRPPGIGGMDMAQMSMVGMGMGMGMFAPPPGVQLPVLVPSPAIPPGSGSAFACSPVLEDGEEDDEGKWGQEEETITGKGLAPALPVVEGINPQHTKEESEPSGTGASTSIGTEGYMVGGSEQQKRPVMGHRHKGSADSISYTMADGDDGKRWVMERRRTGERGEVEILGREVLDGGRI
ncbi:hypothetical protein QBC40DRAFT_233120 [Triangularia verruculosa]|uniref:AGC-kinase C-terminal domain-containing protein n=1 Tax=Triangularia verruculosa TaxID=2587418 RepID=A0AAN7ART6_9PEZI|nr:hypothetical protein QBC40DRAFT_233120 [Triangularia verruculosa]